MTLRRLPHRARRSQSTDRPTCDCGAVSLEVALLAPIIFSLLVLIVFAGRIVDARGDVTSAAGDGARAASLQSSEYEAETAAAEAVENTLILEGVQCIGGKPQPRVDYLSPDGTAGAEFGQGNYVRVTVDCDVVLSDLPTDLPGINFAPSFPAEAHAAEIIDRHRSPG